MEEHTGGRPAAGRVIEDIRRWHAAQVVRCPLVYVLESRLQANVVGRFGEPLHLQHREQFSLLSHLCWFVKAQTPENAVVMWLHKPTVEHPYEWRVRVRVWLAGDYRDGSFHPVWVMGMPLLMVRVRLLLFGNEAAVGEVA